MNKLILSVLVTSFFACDSQNNQQENKKTNGNKTSNQEPSLPEPYATKAARNFCKVIGWGENATPKAPAGFKVESFGNDYKNPRWVYELPNGDILVAETKREPKGPTKLLAEVSGQAKSQSKVEGGNRIILLRDKDHDGKPEMQEVFLEGLFMPFGMVLIKDQFYVACTDAVWRYKYKEGETKINANPEKVVDVPEEGRHWTKSLIANKEGTKLYIGVGSGSDVGENGMASENRRACIIEINPDGTGEKIYAFGLRNPIGMDWDPATGKLWTAVNERDELGDDLVPDYITSVKEDGFYGWPYSYWGQHEEPRIERRNQRLDLIAKAIVPDVDMGSHTACLGLCFYKGKSFPEKYKGGIFVGEHGSWNRSKPSGYKVAFVSMKDGKPGKPEDFLTGFMANEVKNEVYGRPVGVTVLQDGSLLVADDAGNNVWRVSHAK
jgi:glucose/arabinose dehydrogenase